MGRSQKEAELLKSKLKHLFELNPLYVNGISMQAEFNWGVSTYPDEGKELFNLINLSRNRLTQKTKVMAC